MTMRTPIIYSMLAMVGAALLATSCELEHSSNGKLDGFWHLERVDTLQTGGVFDMSQERYFWAVQGKLLHVRNTEDPYTGYFFRFSQTADSLILSQPHSNGGHQSGDDDGDIPITDVKDLRRYGVNHLEEHYHKDQLSSSRLILSTDKLRLYFKKF